VRLPFDYYALIIGNSNYSHMEKLKTPTNDAREIADLLQSRYQFNVKLLIDATHDQIAVAMNRGGDFFFVPVTRPVQLASAM
jgi:Caspase domain